MLALVATGTDIVGLIYDSASVVISLGWEGFFRALVFAVGILFGLAALGPALLQRWAETGYTLWTGQPSRSELKRRCCQLSDELYQFFAERERAYLPIKRQADEHWQKMVSAQTEEERLYYWNKHSQEGSGFYEETMSLYVERFEGRAIILFDTLAQRGWAEPRYRSRFSRPITTFDLRDIAELFLDICRSSDS